MVSIRPAEAGGQPPPRGTESGAVAGTSRDAEDDEGPAPTRAEVVLRYEVTDDPAFESALRSWHVRLHRALDGTALQSQLGVTVLRPLVGNSTSQWEVRLVFRSFAHLGEVIDLHGGTLPVVRGDTDAGWIAIEVDNPVLRHVDIEPVDPPSRPEKPSPRE